MSAVYNPEADVIAEIERLEMDARQTRKRLKHVRQDADRRVLDKQLKDIKELIRILRLRLP
jgi:hypothetical protein